MTSPTFLPILAALAAQSQQQQAQVPVPAAAGTAPGPFAGLAESIPAAYFARPEAQAALQQTLAAPYMQGWQQAAPAQGAAPGGANGAVAPAMTDEQKGAIADQVKDAANRNRNLGYLSNIMSFASGGPVGMGIGLATNFVMNEINNGGFFDTGIDSGWAKKTLDQYGYKRIPGKVTRYMTPDRRIVAAGSLVGELASLIQQHGLTPKKN